MSNNKTHWRTFHPSDYLTGLELIQMGNTVVTIKRSGGEQIEGEKGRKDVCNVIHFEEDVKPMIVNVTNSTAIEKVSGSEFIEDWPGTKIELFPTQRKFKGEMVSAIGVKSTPPVVRHPELKQGTARFNKVRAKIQTEATPREVVEQHYTVSDAVWDALNAEAQ